MKIALLTLALIGSSAASAECITTPRGVVRCAEGGQAAVIHPNAGTVSAERRYGSGVTTVQNSNGAKAAYNPNTGNAATQTRNSNGVKTTQTSRGGTAKTKNGMGVAQGPGGTTCAKGAQHASCR